MENGKHLPISQVKGPTKPSDYRPTSVLLVLSKIFESLILNQVKHFIDKHVPIDTFRLLKRTFMYYSATHVLLIAVK